MRVTRVLRAAGAASLAMDPDLVEEVGADEAMRFLARKLRSPQWWVILDAGNGLAQLHRIFDRYYVDQPETDFDVRRFDTDLGPANVTYLRKRWITARQLAGILHMSHEVLETKRVMSIESKAWTAVEPSPQLEPAWELVREALRLHPPRDAPPGDMRRGL